MAPKVGDPEALEIERQSAKTVTAKYIRASHCQ